jgi:hypothetical protein
MATEADNVNSGALGTLIAVGTIAFFGIALIVTALVRAELAEETEKKDVSAVRAYRDVAAEQRAKLDAPASYIDRAKGTVALPIDRAMELTVEGLKKDPNSATPPAPAGGGSGGSAPPAAAAGGGGAGGTGGAAAGTTNPPAAEAPQGMVGAEKTSQDKPEQDKAEADKKKAEADKKKAPKKPAPTPAAPAPAAPKPAPTPAPAPNGQ